MIDNTPAKYLFIRTCILALRAIAPISVIYCVTLFFFFPTTLFTKLLPLTTILITEAVFCIGVYFPRKIYLQHEAKHPPRLSRGAREELFCRCQENVVDPDWYLSKWFLDAPTTQIRKENVKDFLRWSFFNNGELEDGEEEELDYYLEETEKLLGRDLSPGRGDAKALRVTLDQVDMLHRPLLWYAIVQLVDNFTAVRFLVTGFRFHCQPLSQLFTVFPPRLVHGLSPYRSGSSRLSYWHRPHTSKSQLPVLFIHGIGIGLHPYVDFLTEINKGVDLDGDIGIIAFELMPISFRISREALGKNEMCAQINTILEAHGWEKVVLVSHSYGSVITTHLLHDPVTSLKVGPILLIDPITFLLQLPDVAYNFTARRPRCANEHQLYYFASKDPSVAHTLHRHFFWSENILWKDELSRHRVTVSLAGKDLIVDTEAIGEYLNSGQVGWKERKWTGKEPLETLWFEEWDHAQVFERKQARKALIGVVRTYCALEDGGLQDGAEGETD